MITNDKFENSLNSFKSRLYSPVFSLPDTSDDDDDEDADNRYFLSFKYNINSLANDGFNLGIENYLNGQEERILIRIRGTSGLDRWESVQVYLNNDAYELNRVFGILFSRIFI